MRFIAFAVKTIGGGAMIDSVASQGLLAVAMRIVENK
jgi:hypothetical protein